MKTYGKRLFKWRRDGYVTLGVPLNGLDKSEEEM